MSNQNEAATELFKVAGTMTRLQNLSDRFNARLFIGLTVSEQIRLDNIADDLEKLMQDIDDRQANLWERK